MTRQVTTCKESDTVYELMERMTTGKFRHLPVIEDGRLAGIVSIGDVVKHRLAEMALESNALREELLLRYFQPSFGVRQQWFSQPHAGVAR